jgi:hypothetical protein
MNGAGHVAHTKRKEYRVFGRRNLREETRRNNLQNVFRIVGHPLSSSAPSSSS